MNPSTLPFGRPIEGGRAYAQTCMTCGRILTLRPRDEADPRPAPPELTDLQLARLHFLRWLLGSDQAAPVDRPDPADPPLSAA